MGCLGFASPKSNTKTVEGGINIPIEKISEEGGLKIYGKRCREQCKILFEDVQNGERILDLITRRINIHSFTDLIHYNKPFKPREDMRQSINISLGYLTENTASLFIEDVSKIIDGIELLGSKIVTKKRIKFTFFNLQLDVQPYKIDNCTYLYESKNNVELDKDKTRIVSIRTKKIGNSCNELDSIFADDKNKVKSLHVIWSQPTGERAWKWSKKKHISQDSIHGVCDFFAQFANISPDFFEKYKALVTNIIDEEIFFYIPDESFPLDITAYKQYLQNKKQKQLTLEGMTDAN